MYLHHIRIFAFRISECRQTFKFSNSRHSLPFGGTRGELDCRTSPGCDEHFLLPISRCELSWQRMYAIAPAPHQSPPELRPDSLARGIQTQPMEAYGLDRVSALRMRCKYISTPPSGPTSLMVAAVTYSYYGTRKPESLDQVRVVQLNARRIQRSTVHGLPYAVDPTLHGF